MMSENTGLSAGDVIALTGNRNNNDGMWGDGGWLWAIIALAILGGGWGNGFGFGGGGFGGGFGFPGYGYGGAPVIINSGNDGNCGRGVCATQEDVRNAVDQQTLISKLDQQTYGLAVVFHHRSVIKNNHNAHVGTLYDSLEILLLLGSPEFGLVEHLLYTVQRMVYHGIARTFGIIDKTVRKIIVAHSGEYEVKLLYNPAIYVHKLCCKQQSQNCTQHTQTIMPKSSKPPGRHRSRHQQGNSEQWFR